MCSKDLAERRDAENTEHFTSYDFRIPAEQTDKLTQALFEAGG